MSQAKNMSQAKKPALWTAKESTTILRDRWIHLRADHCVREDGLKIAPYYVLEYPDWVQIVAIDENEHIVLVRQYRHGARRVTLELPSGCVEATDECPIAAGARELREETGYASDFMRHVGTTCVNPANHTNRIYVILAEKARLVGPQQLDPSEDICVETKSVAEVRRLALAGRLHHSAQIASLMIALAAREKKPRARRARRQDSSRIAIQNPSQNPD